MGSALANIGRKIKVSNTIRFISVFYISFVINLFTVKYLFQRDVWIGFSEHVLLQLEFAMLDG